MREFFNGFKDGISKPRWQELLLAGVLAVIAVGAVEFLARDNAHLLLPDSWLFREPKREFGGTNLNLDVCRTVRELRSNRAEGPLILVLGSSESREALPENDAESEADLEEFLGRNIDYHNLATSGLFPPDFLFLTEMIGDMEGGLIIATTSPILLMAMPDEYVERSAMRDRWPITYSAPVFEGVLQEFGYDASFRSALTILRPWARRGFVPKLTALATGAKWDPYEVTRYLYTGDYGYPWPESYYGQERYDKWYKDYFTSSSHSPDLGLRSLEELHRLTKARGARLILVEATAHSSLQQLQPELIASYRATLDPFLEEHAIPYYNLQARAGITGESFHDFVHIMYRRGEYWEAFREMVEIELEESP